MQDESFNQKNAGTDAEVLDADAGRKDADAVGTESYDAMQGAADSAAGTGTEHMTQDTFYADNAAPAQNGYDYQNTSYRYQQSDIYQDSLSGRYGQSAYGSGQGAQQGAAYGSAYGTGQGNSQGSVYGTDQSNSQGSVYGTAQGSSQDSVYGTAQGSSQSGVYGTGQGRSYGSAQGSASGYAYGNNQGTAGSAAYGSAGNTSYGNGQGASYSRQGTVYGSGQGSAGNYNSYNAAASNAYADNNDSASKKEKAKESRKLKKERRKAQPKNTSFRKVALSAACGLAFGLIAAVSFFAIRQVEKNLFPDTDSSNIQVVTEVADTSDVSDTSASQTDASASNAQDEIAKQSDLLQTTSTTTVETTDVSDMVERVMPSIVSVINSYTSNYYYYTAEEQASGSGIIIGTNDEELLIVTNYHVIEDNDTISVIFCDETEATALVKGQDTEMDLAVIAVQLSDISSDTKNNISIATMGDSDSIRVGETAVAIGNALGLGQSVSRGIISAVNREMDVNGVKGTFIQTDAAINQGNSGGALLNINGEVIGINSSKIGGDTVEGMGYAIPITAAKPILEELMVKETKKLVDEDKQSYLGISGATITSQEQMFYGYPDGVYVANVYDGTAAEEAGLQKGDFIYSFDGEAVSSMEDLQKLLLYYEEGTTVEIKIYRYSPAGYQDMTLTVTLGSRNDIKD